MKKIIRSLILTFFIFTAGILYVPAKTPVLVELFTSQGCPTCPAADKVLAQLETTQPVAGAEIITLAWHVNLWDSFNWKDEFSSPVFTQRQVIYSRTLFISEIYTPQMFVDGTIHFIGSKSDKATKAITQAIKTAKPEIDLSMNGEKLLINIPKLPKHETATVYLAFTEDNLVRKIGRGNNEGKTLEHPSVARRLQAIAAIDAQLQQFKAETFLQIQPEWNRENLKIIVFVQENATRKILAVERLNLSGNEKLN